MKVASGFCDRVTGPGQKGMPTCRVVHTDDGDNIDLLPLGWLWKRGCNYSMNGDGLQLQTPKGTQLPVFQKSRLEVAVFG